MSREIGLGKARELGFTESFLRAKEPKIDGALAEMLEMIPQPGFVVWTDRSDVDRSAIAQDLFGAVDTRVHGAQINQPFRNDPPQEAHDTSPLRGSASSDH